MISLNPRLDLVASGVSGAKIVPRRVHLGSILAPEAHDSVISREVLISLNPRLDLVASGASGVKIVPRRVLLGSILALSNQIESGS